MREVDDRNFPKLATRLSARTAVTGFSLARDVLAGMRGGSIFIRLMKEVVLGRVASLHLHPKISGDPFASVPGIDLEQGKGIIGNPRYFARRSRSGGFSKRQVSLMEREQIAEHAASFGLEKISPGVVRSNIETIGVKLCDWVGAEMRIGEAVLFFYEARTPCEKMDAICVGLRAAMENKRQGVLAQVVKSGKIEVGDEIALVKWIKAN